MYQSMINKNQILTFLKKNELAVVSTASKNGKPQSAVIAYAIKDDFTILWMTDEKSRKNKNIRDNNQICLVIGGFNNDPTVQIEGITKKLDDKNTKKAKQFMLSLYPEWASYFKSPGAIFYSIKPNWIRFSDFTKVPALIKEFKLK